jgi:hypothetical protein
VSKPAFIFSPKTAIFSDSCTLYEERIAPVAHERNLANSVPKWEKSEVFFAFRKIPIKRAG